MLYATGLLEEAAALGIAHPTLGQAILVVVKPAVEDFQPQALLDACRRELPNYMVPQRVEVVRDSLPRNPNGKIDRRALAAHHAELFTAAEGASP